MIVIISGITQLHAGGVTLVAHFATPFDFADLTLRMDSLGIYGAGYLLAGGGLFALFIDLYARIRGKGAAAMGFFMNLFIASMVALLVMGQRFLVHRAV